ncbi:MAG: hypothetical protein HYV63_03100 [Candidatus Schekmanbacteria bacterium]|nr:hypothetical protein [Candidatus Schekmanbacteria bacterium]
MSGGESARRAGFISNWRTNASRGRSRGAVAASGLLVALSALACGGTVTDPGSSDAGNAAQVAGSTAVLVQSANRGVSLASGTTILGPALGQLPVAMVPAPGANAAACPAVSFPDGFTANPFRIVADWGTGCQPSGSSPTMSGRIIFTVTWGTSTVSILADFDSYSISTASVDGSVTATATSSTVTYVIDGTVSAGGRTTSIVATLSGTWDDGVANVTGDESFTLGGSGSYNASTLGTGSFQVSSPLVFSSKCSPYPDLGTIAITWPSHSASADFNTGNCATVKVSVDGMAPIEVGII